MLVVPGVLFMGPAVLLAVAPHANLYLLLLVPAGAHGHLLPTPRLHGLRAWSKAREREISLYNLVIIRSQVSFIAAALEVAGILCLAQRHFRKVCAYCMGA